LVCECPQRREIARRAGEVHGDDRLGALRHALFDRGEVLIISRRPEVGEDRHTLLKQDACDRPDIGERRGDHFVPRPDPGRCHCDVHRRRARGTRDHLLPRANLPKTFDLQRRLLVGPFALPMKQRGLVHRRTELRLFPRIPPHPRTGLTCDGLRGTVLREFHGAAVCRICPRHFGRNLRGHQRRGLGCDERPAGNSGVGPTGYRLGYWRNGAAKRRTCKARKSPWRAAFNRPSAEVARPAKASAP
jgi:hypothetical protein